MDVAHFPGTWLQTTAGTFFVRRNDPGGGRPDAWRGDPDGQRNGLHDTSPALLFVHGLGGDSLDWADLVAVLADRDPELACYAVDLPGFGASLPPPDADVSLDAHARALDCCIEVLGLGPVHLVANSMGAAIAVRLVARRPVASLTLICPALPDPRPPRGSWQLLPAAFPLIGPRLVAAGLRADPDWIVEQALRLCYGDPGRVGRDRRELLRDVVQRRATAPHGVDAYCGSLRSLIASYLRPWRLWRELAAVRVPVLVIQGERDKLVRPRRSRRIADRMRAGFALLPDVGHVPQLEAPEVVADLLASFVRETWGRERTGEESWAGAAAGDATYPAEGMPGPRGTVEPSASRGAPQQPL